MATDLEKLVVQLSADIKGYEREMRKAVGVTNRQAREIEKRFNAMNRNLDGIGKRAARSLVAPFAGIAAALGGRELIRMTGEWTDLTSRVNLAAGSMEKGAVVMGRISDVARRTYSDLSQTAEGYLAFATTLTELGVSTDRQLDFVESLNNALVVSGAKGDTATRVMDALSKAMALGTLQGDNLNTVVASGGRVADALAASMGVTTTELRRLGQQGKIGRREILGITQEMEKLRREADKMPATIQDGFMLLNNALLEYVGRGDEAVGMSARIAEALKVIADNFDTVADAGLKLAAVLAAGMLGRSIAGMVVSLGGAITVLARFGAALKAATSLVSVGTAIGGLSAAAGPLGMLFGGLLAGGVLLYTDRAREAEHRSNDLRNVLREMGHDIPGFTSQIEEAVEAIDQIGSDDQLDRIRRLKEGLQGLVGDNSWKSWLLGDSSEMGKIADNLEMEGARWFGGDSGKIARETADLVRQLQSAKISAAEFAAAMNALDDTNASEYVRGMVAELRLLASGASEARDELLAAGEADPVFEQLNHQLDIMRDMLFGIAAIDDIHGNITRSVDEIIDAMRKGEMSAADAEQAILDLGAVNPSFATALGNIASVIGRLGALAAAARNAHAAIRDGGADGDTSAAVEGAATTAYLEERRRQNSLSREQQDIEKRTERILKDAAANQAVITQEMATQLAIEEAAADARRAAEAKADRASGAGKKGAGRKKKEEPGLFEDVERDLLNLEREIKLIGKSTAEVAKARAEWAMLDEAKKRGIKVSDKLRGKIEAEAAQVGRLTAELEAGQLAQQQFEAAVDGVADALAGALVAGESLRDGLAQVFKQIAADLIQSGIHRMIGSLFLGGGGGLGFLGALLPGRASGGPVRAGQPYMVGERGPEPFVPAVDGRILSVSQAQAALRGGAGSGGTVRVIIEEAPGFAARVRTEAQGVAVSVVAGTTRRQSDRQYLGGAR